MADIDSPFALRRPPPRPETPAFDRRGGRGDNKSVAFDKIGEAGAAVPAFA
jgi:hypothetical protein